MKRLFAKSDKMKAATSSALAELRALPIEELIALGAKYASSDTAHFLQECADGYEEEGLYSSPETTYDTYSLAASVKETAASVTPDSYAIATYNPKINLHYNINETPKAETSITGALRSWYLDTCQDLNYRDLAGMRAAA